MSQPVHIRSRTLTTTLILLAVVAIAFGTYKLVDRYVVNPEINPSDLDIATLQTPFQQAPHFSLLDLNGSPFAIQDHTDKIVIVNFWATWCKPCLDELPSLLQFSRSFEKEILILAISQDKNSSVVLDFFKNLKIKPSSNFITLLDPFGQTANSYGTSALPESYILKKGLKFYRKISGFRDWQSPASIQEMSRLLKE
ncbi:MAG: TlpA family protein disulfide reductase [Bdellovibrionales bacterium]